MKKANLIFSLIFCCLADYAQAITPIKIGDRVPDELWKKLPGHDVKKLIILDFWNTHCSTCIAIFPKMEALQKQFDADIQVLLVNDLESASLIKNQFDIINKRGNLKVKVALPVSLPAINGDSTFKMYFPHESVPHHVWINANREVIAITGGYNATPDNVSLALANRTINAGFKNDADRALVTENGILTPSTASLPVALYSCFMPYNLSLPAGASRYVKDTIRKTYRFSNYGSRVESLYEDAYSRSFSDEFRIRWEVSDTCIYKPDRQNFDDWKQKYLFAYEVTGLLSESRDEFLSLMKRDVDKYVGIFLGIEAKMEKREFECLALVKTRDGLLPEGKGMSTSTGSDSIFHWKNAPFYVISDYLRPLLEDMSLNRPFVDETGLKEQSVDMILKGDRQNLDNLRLQLAVYGLDIIKVKRKLEVLVIQDKQRPPPGS